MELKVCRSCKIEKPLDDFYVNEKYVGGHVHQCRECTKTYNSEYLRRRQTCIKKNKNGGFTFPGLDGAKLEGVTTKDGIGMYKLLNSMGYKVNSTKSIHQQFCEKYNLPIKHGENPNDSMKFIAKLRTSLDVLFPQESPSQD